MTTRRIQNNSGSKEERAQWQQKSWHERGWKSTITTNKQGKAWHERGRKDTMTTNKQGKACHERRRTWRRARRQKNAKNKVGPKLKLDPPLVEAIKA